MDPGLGKKAAVAAAVAQFVSAAVAHDAAGVCHSYAPSGFSSEDEYTQCAVELENNIADIRAMRVKRIRVAGNQATATVVTMKLHGSARTANLPFVFEDGGWYLTVRRD